jgi:hypothetical protein
MSKSWYVEEITPAFAQELLDVCRGDNINRMSAAAEDQHMDKFRGIIERDEWRETHQGIALGVKVPGCSESLRHRDLDRFLADGVHRLGGCVRAGKSIRVVICRDDNLRSVHDLPIDKGKPRSISFNTGRDSKLISIAGYALKHHAGAPKFAAMGEDEVARFADFAEKAWRDLGFDADLPTSRRLLRSAPFQLACIMHLMGETSSREYLTKIISAMLAETPGSMPPMFASFYFQYTKATNRGRGRLELPRLFRATTEELGGQMTFKSTPTDSAKFSNALRKVFKPVIPIGLVAVPDEGTAKAKRTHWTPEDDALLFQGSKGGWSSKKIAIITRRTIPGVRNRASELGLSLSR